MDAIFTPEQLAEVRAYHAPRYVFAAIDTVAWPVLLALLVRYGTRPLHAAAQRLAARLEARFPDATRGPFARALVRIAQALWRGPGWGTALLFSLMLFGLFALADLPTDIYFGYVREHAYGMSRMSPWTFALDQLKANVVMGVAVSALAFGMFGLARRLPAWWWVMGLVASVAMVGSAAVDPYRSRLYVDQAPLPEGELRERISALMRTAGIDFREVLVDKTSDRTVRLQASFAGTGPTRTIILNDSLVTGLDTAEALAAVAHEAGHVGESRWPARAGAAATLLAFLFLVERLFRASAKRGWFGITERADVRTLPLVLLIFDLGMTAAAPLSGALSREREYAADRYAIQLTHDAAAFRRMLTKAARINKMDPDPPRWYVLRGLSHPPIGERIEAIDRVAGQTDGG